MLTVIDRSQPSSSIPEAYDRTLRLQLDLLEEKAANRGLEDYLIYVEHDHVYTTGRGTELVVAGQTQVPTIEISRGGQATYHGPGQLVAYPIFDLNRHGRDVHVYLRRLETVVINLLSQLGLTAQQVAGQTGVWVETAQGLRKICSIGVGVRKWITYHGLALNVNPDLSYFHSISPCGLAAGVMTSLAELLGSACPSMDQVKNLMTEAFKSEFDFSHDHTNPLNRPAWIKVKAPGSQGYGETDQVVKNLRLVTVCEEAQCPNIGECWTHHTATFMIMGELCTRRCSFCSVKDGVKANLDPLDPLEPYRVAKAVQELGLEHVVVTSVNRDDVADMGASHFYQTAKLLHQHVPACRIEFLIPDMQGRRELIEIILKDNLLSVLNHNFETVPRLYRTVRPGAQVQRSLNILKWAKEIQPEVKTKSGIMLGLGETRQEVLEVMDLLRSVGCDILTIGQYLRPSQKQLPVQRFVTPVEFKDYAEEAYLRGFAHVESGTFVRSSYHAWKHADGAEEALRSAAQA
ncbi:lipoyl synthase [bacterium]|nr:lipoyl synthase [bacterium]